MLIAKDWKDYKILDTSGGEKLEQIGDYILVRPDPQVVWKTEKKNPLWKDPNGVYHRSSSGGGSWEIKSLPEKWQITYKDLKFNVGPFSFKHIGIFPEQAVNWDFLREQIKKASRPVKALNLFAYTGGATVAMAKENAFVTHVDASRGMVSWAKDNAGLSHIGEDKIRWIVDDCRKFVEREIRRGNKYDILVMDPPSYGRGAKGEVWKMEDNIYEFLCLCSQLLSEKPLAVVVNSYTTGLSPGVLRYLLETAFKNKGGSGISEEIGLPVTDTGLVLPCGATGRMTFL